MANIEKRGDSYRITVSNGYSGNRKLREKMTWKPEPGMTKRQIEKKLFSVAYEFEKKVKDGNYLDGEKLSFAEFVEIWTTDYAEKKLKPKSQQWYSQMLESRILPALGHHTLAKIQPIHIIRFLKDIQKVGGTKDMRHKAKDATTIRKIWKASGKRASDGINSKTLTEVLTGRNVSAATAKNFSKMVSKKPNDIFEPVSPPRALSDASVAHHLRAISSILSKAVGWQVIESNPCRRVPGVRSDKSAKLAYLEIEEAQKLIEDLMKIDDIQLQTIIIMFLYTGIRKGELIGLKWSDIDFDKGTITIQRTLQQLPGKGYVEGTPKTRCGERILAMSDDLIWQLKRYKVWHNGQKVLACDQWQFDDRTAFNKAEREAILKDPNHALREFEPIPWIFTRWNGLVHNPATLYHKVKQYLTNVGYPDMTVHGLRHTNISLLLSQGVDLITVSRRAGHAKVSTTSDIYAHALKRPDEKAADKLNELLRPAIGQNLENSV